MSIETLYTFSAARRLTGANPNLITYLVRDRQIPHHVVGKLKVLDESGLRLLKKALAEYRQKPMPQPASA